MLLLMLSLAIDFSFVLRIGIWCHGLECMNLSFLMLSNGFRAFSLLLILKLMKFLKQTPYKLSEINFSISVHISIRSQIFSLFIITIRLNDSCVYAHSIKQFNSLIWITKFFFSSMKPIYWCNLESGKRTFSLFGGSYLEGSLWLNLGPNSQESTKQRRKHMFECHWPFFPLESARNGNDQINRIWVMILMRIEIGKE